MVFLPVIYQQCSYFCIQGGQVVKFSETHLKKDNDTIDKGQTTVKLVVILPVMKNLHTRSKSNSSGLSRKALSPFV